MEGKALRYFKPHEFACKCRRCGKGFDEMDPTLLAMLDELRHKVGEPLIISSAYRCKEHNSEVGGVSGSSHMKGLAVDIECWDSYLRFKIVKEAIFLGFRRIEPATTWVHLDIDNEKPQDVLFFGKE